MTKRIAVVLTGYIGEKYNSLYAVKKLFERVREVCNVELDLYCHMWSPDNRYHASYVEGIGNLIIPQELEENQTRVQEILNPREIIVDSYMDMHVEFNTTLVNELEYLSNFDIDNEAYIDYHKKNLIKNKLLHKLYDYKMHPRTLIEISLDKFSPTYKFKHLLESYYKLYLDWANFIQNHVQAYSLESGCRAIINSGIVYDGVLRWRYDCMADLQPHRIKEEFGKLFDTKHSAVFHSGLDLIHEINDINLLNTMTIDYNNKDTYIGLQDLYYYFDYSLIDLISKKYYKNYHGQYIDAHNYWLSKKMNVEKSPVNPHIQLWSTLRDLNIPIELNQINIYLGRVFELSDEDEIEKFFTAIDWKSYKNKHNTSITRSLTTEIITCITNHLSLISDELDQLFSEDKGK